MKAYHDKCHMLLSTQDEANTQIADLKWSSVTKILEITVDNKLRLTCRK